MGITVALGRLLPGVVSILEATESMEYRVFDNATSFGLDGLIAHGLPVGDEILRLAQKMWHGI